MTCRCEVPQSPRSQTNRLLEPLRVCGEGTVTLWGAGAERRGEYLIIRGEGYLNMSGGYPDFAGGGGGGGGV